MEILSISIFICNSNNSTIPGLPKSWGVPIPWLPATKEGLGNIRGGESHFKSIWLQIQGYCQRPLAALVGHLSKEPTMCSNLSELKWTIRDQGNLSETSWSLDYNPNHLSRCTYKPNYVKQPLWTLRLSEIKGTSLNQSELSVIIVDQSLYNTSE